MRRKRLLITGSSGFVGQWCQRSGALPPEWQMVPVDSTFDLRVPATILANLEASPPDAVLHLAAQSFVPASFEDPHATFDVNLIGTLNLLQALARIGFHGRFIFVSSADVYGQVPIERMPIAEEVRPDPRNPYAVSKLAAEMLCRQWRHSDELDVVIVRPFNHIGPGQDPRFAVSGLARQFVRIRNRRQPPSIEVGDLDVARDFTDVRDVVRAYFALLEQGEGGRVYNVCSGRPTRLREIFRLLGSITGVEPRIVVEASRLRPNEQRSVTGDARLLELTTGWAPGIDLRQSLEEVCRYWEERVHDDREV